MDETECSRSLETHKFAGLDGVRCGFYLGPWVTIRTVLSWNSVTCPECLALKQDWEPTIEHVDTRGD